MRSPAHIMMTTDAVGGVWVYALALCKRLAEAGHRVTLVTLGPPPQGARDEEARALPAAIELIVTDLSLEWLDPEGGDTKRARKELAGLAGRLQPDVVHINSYREGSIDWPCPSVVVAHSCVLSWWEAVYRERPSEARWTAYAQAVRAGLNDADVWVAPTQAFHDCIERIYRPAAAGCVIPNGIDVAAEPGVTKEPFILAAGRIWDRGKNLMVLAEIAPALPWPVYIAGAGAPHNADAPANVRWLGEIGHSELQDWMRRAAIYVAPAFYEPFGLGILEAARAGCALVLSDIASLRELWDGASADVSLSEPDCLRRALTHLCGDGQARQSLQLAAANRARRYSLDRTAAAYLQLYDRLIAGAACGRKPLPIGSERAA